jgi:hypothetical protein
MQRRFRERRDQRNLSECRYPLLNVDNQVVKAVRCSAIAIMRGFAHRTF